jgi:hypothetical protein
MPLSVVEPVAEISSPGLWGVRCPVIIVLRAVQFVSNKVWKKFSSEGFGKHMHSNALDPSTVWEMTP